MIMKKNVLALSVAAALGAGFAGTASAVSSIKEAGIGHALIVPYFTTQNGNATLLNIVNTDTVYGKAVKVRFRSAVDSDDIFDFQVFLSPADVWTANVSKGSDGRSVLTTTDKSCTLPSNVNQSFVTSRLAAYTDGSGVVHDVNEQTREGYVEIFNMGDIPQFLPTGAGAAAWALNGPITGATTRSDYVASTTVNPLYTAIKHVAGVAPCTQATLLGIEAAGAAWFVTAPISGGVGGANYPATQQIIAPSTGLMGNWTVINVPATRTFAGSMTAIQANSVAPATQTMMVYSGQTGTARVATHLAAANGVNVFPALALTEDGVLLNQAETGVATADYDFPDMSTPYETDGLTPPGRANALSTALLRQTVVNEFITDPGISAGTDWVISMPTRRYHVAGRGVSYGNATDTKGYPAAQAIEGIAGGVTAPFVAANTTFAANGRSACIATGFSPAFWNREEVGATGGGAVISPGVPTTYSLCGEVNVLSWNNSGATTSTLGATLIVANSSASPTTDGWARMVLSPLGTGLPVQGSAFVKAFNGAVSAGVSGNFGAAWEHRYQ